MEIHVSLFKTYLKGIAMGAADVVPGVSGGTIAFITGILDTLLESINKIKPSLFKLIKEKGFKTAFNHINGGFLISLFAGILTSIFSLAKLISWLLVAHPVPIWSFFFGLILISVVHVLKQVKGFTAVRGVTFLAGMFVAYAITQLSPAPTEVNTLSLFIGGAIAICAMVLPGISGSFLLLLLGLYSTVLGAAKGFDISILAIFAAGALTGLLTFSRLLSALLKKWHNETLTFLTGLMLGTLGKIWPWKIAENWRINSHGDKVPLLEKPLSPFAYEQITGQPHQLWLAIACMFAAIALVWGLEKFARKN
nr:DUF368 domain-containing protein [Parashewanella hymeniacidonis]